MMLCDFEIGFALFDPKLANICQNLVKHVLWEPPDHKTIVKHVLLEPPDHKTLVNHELLETPDHKTLVKHVLWEPPDHKTLVGASWGLSWDLLGRPWGFLGPPGASWGLLASDRPTDCVRAEVRYHTYGLGKTDLRVNVSSL